MSHGKRCQYQNGDDQCTHEVVPDADYCALHINERYAVPDSLAHATD
jgi:hypothetical protein